jgi:uncharacterized protein YerC
MNELPGLKWQQAVEECRLHIRRLRYSVAWIGKLLPLSDDDYAHLDDEAVAHIDQVIYRFTKLQDAMGERLFVAALMCLEETVRGKPFLDILNRLEELEALPSRERWNVLRGLRNELTHEYPGEEASRIEAINMVCRHTEELVKICQTIVDYVDAKTTANRSPSN